MQCSVCDNGTLQTAWHEYRNQRGYKELPEMGLSQLSTEWWQPCEQHHVEEQGFLCSVCKTNQYSSWICYVLDRLHCSCFMQNVLALEKSFGDSCHGFVTFLTTCIAYVTCRMFLPWKKVLVIFFITVYLLCNTIEVTIIFWNLGVRVSFGNLFPFFQGLTENFQRVTSNAMNLNTLRKEIQISQDGPCWLWLIWSDCFSLHCWRVFQQPQHQ